MYTYTLVHIHEHSCIIMDARTLTHSCTLLHLCTLMINCTPVHSHTSFVSILLYNLHTFTIYIYTNMHTLKHMMTIFTFTSYFLPQPQNQFIWLTEEFAPNWIMNVSSLTVMNHSEKLHTLKDVMTIVATIVAWLGSQADVSCNGGYATCLTTNRLSLIDVLLSYCVSMLVAKPTCHPGIANCPVYGGVTSSWSRNYICQSSLSKKGDCIYFKLGNNVNIKSIT